MADREREESAARGFDFGQFRHRSKDRGSGPRGAIVCCAAEYTLHSLAFRHIRALAADTGRPLTTQEVELGSFSSLCHRRRDFGSRGREFGPRAIPGSRPAHRSNAWRRDCPATPANRPPRTDSAPDAGLSPELMYRLLLGDVALQRGEPALAARAYLEAARETRDPTLARRATEIAVGARARALSIESARLWSDIDPAAQRPKQLIAALAGSAGTKGFDSPGVGNDLKAELERVLAEAASSPAASGRSLPAAQPAARLGARQAGDAAARRIGCAALSRPRRGTLRRCARRVQHRAQRAFDVVDGAARDRSCADPEAGLGTRGDAEGRDPEQAFAGGGHRLSDRLHAGASGFEGRGRIAGAALRRAEALRRSARDLRALLGRGQGQSRLRVRDRGARRPDEGLGRRRETVPGPEAGELRRERRRRALPCADRRRDRALRARVRPLPRGSGRRAGVDRETPRRDDAREAEPDGGCAPLSRRPAGRHDRAAGPGATGRGAASARCRRQRRGVRGADEGACRAAGSARSAVRHRDGRRKARQDRRRRGAAHAADRAQPRERAGAERAGVHARRPHERVPRKVPR